MGNFGSKHLFVFSLLLLLGSCYKYSYTYKLVNNTLPATHSPPAQTPLAGPVAEPACCKGKYCWQFTPLFNYDITGLVFGVSHKLSSEFDDIMVADAGMVWGENSAMELYKDVKLRVMMDHSEARWEYGVKFNMQELANTHLATCDDAAFSAIKKIMPGDQVRLRGWLANGKASEKPGETDPSRILNWTTSVVRGDNGDGACEILYVRSAEDIQILKKGPRRWYWLRWLGLAGMFLAAVLWHMGLRREIEAAQKLDL